MRQGRPSRVQLASCLPGASCSRWLVSLRQVGLASRSGFPQRTLCPMAMPLCTHHQCRAADLHLHNPGRNCFCVRGPWLTLRPPVTLPMASVQPLTLCSVLDYEQSWQERPRLPGWVLALQASVGPPPLFGGTGECHFCNDSWRGGLDWPADAWEHSGAPQLQRSCSRVTKAVLSPVAVLGGGHPVCCTAKGWLEQLRYSNRCGGHVH